MNLIQRIKPFSNHFPAQIFYRRFADVAPKAVLSSNPVIMKEGTGGRSSISGRTVTVFGCSGFLGSKLVNRLARQGTQVIVPYRGDDYTNRHLKLMGDLGQIVPMKFNIYDEEALMTCVRHSDVVYNLIGKDYETKSFTFEQTHVHASRNIAYVCRQMKVPMLVQMSHLNADLQSPSNYLKTKAQAEVEVKKEFPNATIVRSASAYGHEDRFIHLFGYLSGLPFIPIYNQGNTIFRPVCGSDVATGLASLAFNMKTAGNTYEFYGPQSYTFNQLVDIWLHIAYIAKSKVEVPKHLAKLHAYIYEKTDIDPFLCPDTIERFYINETPKLSHALTLKDVGVIQPKIFEYTAIEYIRVYRESSVYQLPGPIPTDHRL